MATLSGWWRDLTGESAEKRAGEAQKLSKEAYEQAGSSATDIEEESKTREAEASLRAQAADARARGDETAAQGYEASANQYKAQADQYRANIEKSIGGSAADYARLARESATIGAGQQASDVSGQAAKAQLKAGRTAGLNAGQAALAAGQGTADVYGNQYQQAIETGLNQYSTGLSAQQQQQAAMAAQQQAETQNALSRRGLATTQRGQGLQEQAIRQAGMDTRAGLTAQRYGAAAQQQAAAQAGYGQGAAARTGTLAGAGEAAKVAGQVAQLAMSDKNVKTNIKPSSPDRLAELLKNVKPVQFNYKDEGSDKTRQGVLAQDLEKTSMKDNVVETPQGKAVDIGQQTMSNTSLIIELAAELSDLRKKIKQYEGAK